MVGLPTFWCLRLVPMLCVGMHTRRKDEVVKVFTRNMRASKKDLRLIVGAAPASIWSRSMQVAPPCCSLSNREHVDVLIENLYGIQ